jgi:probable phosphoglycerate mutase
MNPLGGRELAQEEIRTTIVIVRHGECAGNREGLFRGRCDFPLNECGLRQAEALANELKGLGLCRIFSSPLSRATETAAKIAETCGTVWETRSGFNNIALGKWEGRPKKEVEEEYPEEWRLWIEHPDRLHVPGGESLADVQRRAFSNLEHLVRTYRGETFAVVSHRGVIKPLLAACLGLAEPSFWKLHVDTASYSILVHGEKRGYCLTLLNQNRHLAEMVQEWV